MASRWWGGRTTVARAIPHIPEPIAEVDVEGVRGLVLERDVAELASIEPTHPARLLPGFDPFTNELPRHVEAVLAEDRHARVHRTAGWVSQVAIVDGRVAGTWTIDDGAKGAGRVVLQRFGRWRAQARKEIKPEVERLAAFLDRPLTLEFGV